MIKLRTYVPHVYACIEGKGRKRGGREKNCAECYSAVKRFGVPTCATSRRRVSTVIITELRKLIPRISRYRATVTSSSPSSASTALFLTRVTIPRKCPPLSPLQFVPRLTLSACYTRNDRRVTALRSLRRSPSFARSLSSRRAKSHVFRPPRAGIYP